MKTSFFLILFTILTTIISFGQFAPNADFTCDSASTIPYCCIDFSDLSSNSPSNWQWSFGDGDTAASQNPYHCFPNPGVYVVSLIVANANGSDTIFKSVVTTNCNCMNPVGIVESENMSSRFQISPNPFSVRTRFKSEAELTNATLFIYNSIGIQVEVITGIFEKEFVLQRNNLKSGIYFVRLVQSDNVISIRRLVVIE